MCAVPEILNIVLENLRVHHGESDEVIRFSKENLVTNKERRRALRRAALASKAMAEIALPILWSSIDCFSVILRLISTLDCQWESENDGVERVQNWFLSEPLTPSIASRIKYYSTFIRHLDVKAKIKHKDWEFDRSVIFQVVALTATNGSLFPNLERLVISPQCQYSLMFLSPKLRTLWIRPDPHLKRSAKRTKSAAAWNLIDALPTHTPALEELRIETWMTYDNFLTILRLEHLRKLSLSPIDFDGYGSGDDAISCALLDNYARDLFGIKSLQFLDPGPIYYDSSSFEGTQVLRGMSLHRSPHETLVALACLTNHTLERFELEGFQYGSDKVRAQKLLKELAGAQHLSLTKLTLKNWSNLDASWIKPLLQARGMKNFEVTKPCCSSLSDAALEEIALAWPHLETFKLYSNAETTAVTLDAIQSFAKHCPNLHQLHLDVHAVKKPVSKFKPIRPLANVTLFSVSTWSRVGKADEAKALKYLRTVFPSLLYAFVDKQAVAGGHSSGGDFYSWGKTPDPRDWQGIIDSLNAGKFDREVGWMLEKVYQPRDRI